MNPAVTPATASTPGPIAASMAATIPAPIPFLRRLFSFPVAIAAMLVALAVLTTRSRFNDPDMWWHLKTGQVILATGKIPHTDIYSFTTGGHAWIPHEWLSQVVIFAAYRWGAYSGLMHWLCLASSAVFVAGYLLCSLYSGNAKVSVLGALAIFVFSTVGLSIRPQILGYLLLIVELIVIHLGRTRSPRWFWALPPLFVLWINIHGSFFLGLVLAAIFLFSSFFQFRAGSLVAVRWPTRTRTTFILALALTLPALLLNPGGLRQVTLPVDFLLNQPLNLASVQEWRPLELNSERGVCFLALLAACVLLLALRVAELHWDEMLLLAAAVWLAGSHDRMLFVFGILAAPILSRMLAGTWDNYDPAADRIAPNAVLISLAALVAWAAFPSSDSLQRQVDAVTPGKAIQFIRSHHLPGPMLNDYKDGGYLIWAMPEHPVFIDGRAEVYEWAGVLQQFSDWENLNADPNALLDKYNIQFCLLAPGMPEARILPLLRNWKVVYSDGLSVILVRARPGPLDP